jgi:hypothetical protein
MKYHAVIHVAAIHVGLTNSMISNCTRNGQETDEEPPKKKRKCDLVLQTRYLQSSYNLKLVNTKTKSEFGVTIIIEVTFFFMG